MVMLLVAKKLTARIPCKGIWILAHDLGMGEGWKWSLDPARLDEISNSNEPNGKTEVTITFHKYTVDMGDTYWGPGNDMYDSFKKMEIHQ
jgi:hypothetical protein